MPGYETYYLDALHKNFPLGFQDDRWVIALAEKGVLHGGLIITTATQIFPVHKLFLEQSF
jgi:hypothetical protein